MRSEKGRKLNFHGKKYAALIISAVVIIVLAAPMLSGCGKTDNSQGSATQSSIDVRSSSPLQNTEEEKIKIVSTEAEKPRYETFDNGLFSMTIPKGWIVTTLGDYLHYTIRVTPQDNTDYQIFYNFKTEGYSKSDKVKRYWQTYFPNGGFGDFPVISEYTAECFFNCFSMLGPLNNTQAFTFPVINDFEVTENFGATIYGGDLLRACFENENGRACDGLFTATVYNAGKYMVNSNPFDFSSELIDTYPLSVYNTIIISAPDGEFVSYESVLNSCIASLQFSGAFMQGFAQQQDAVLSQVQANIRINSQISDMIMSSWESRSSAYDIISQKRSDATLGYERVYDTETGGIYKAYNGFTDDYTGERYKPVTDEMYKETINGYIEK